MGILNVTPDSFSDGGRWTTLDDAVGRGLALAAEGADIVDVGGESTRPGAAGVAPDEEAQRVVPVIARLARQTTVPLSVDTRHAEVARAALAAGACIVNDVSALGDPAMAGVARAAGAGVVLMHMRGTPVDMQRDPRYDDVTAEVQATLRGRVAAARAAGIEEERIAVDPGIGFGKTTAHNLALLRNLDRLVADGYPVVVGLSRKRFIGEIADAPVQDRLAGSLAGLVWCAWHGAAVLRVHDVAASRQALRVALALAAERVDVEQP
jgi:dihydropteroate synthase